MQGLNEGPHRLHCCLIMTIGRMREGRGVGLQLGLDQGIIVGVLTWAEMEMIGGPWCEGGVKAGTEPEVNGAGNDDGWLGHGISTLLRVTS